MDRFSLCLTAVTLAGQCVLQLRFLGRLAGKKPRWQLFAAYLLLLFLLDGAAAAAGLPAPLCIGLQLLALYAAARLTFAATPAAAGAAALLAVYIMQLAFGVVGSAEALLFPYFIGRPLLYLLVAAATALALALCELCYGAVQRLVTLPEMGLPGRAGVLLCPALFFFIAELYILQVFYSQMSAPAPTALAALQAAGRHTALLALQLLGLAALLCSFGSYRQLCRSFHAQAELRSLRQAAQAQRAYLDAAQNRYEQTRRFRHDIKNHLLVLRGLLAEGEGEKARDYLQRLEGAAGALSFPYRTGNPVVDILLAEKLAPAAERGVRAEAALLLPEGGRIDDLDLCILFSNALDNALAACCVKGQPGTIRIGGRRQGDFYLLTFQNSCEEGPLPPPGTGLSNIRAVAEKYHGVMTAEKAAGLFSLDILLNISLPPADISGQKPCGRGPEG